jgi:hypothetical protein
MYSILSFDFLWIFRWFLLLDGRRSNWIHLSTETNVILLCGKSDAMPPDEFWTKLCDSFTAFYDNILKKSGAEGRSVAKNLSCKFVTQTASVPNPPVVHARTLWRHQRQRHRPLPTLPLQSLHRRRPLRRYLQRPPKNRRCRRSPPIRAGEVTEWEAGPAAVGWNILELALVWLDAVVSNTALSAWQNCSSESSSRAAYPDWILRFSTCQYVPPVRFKRFSYGLIPPCTSIYHCLYHLVPSCTILYHLVPPCTVQVQGSTYQYIP